MAASQLIFYSSSDANGPGLMFGAVGDLLRVLDLCLVTGYTGKAAAGWTKPIANSGNIGCYKQGAGSLLNLVINDNGPNVTSVAREAWAIGWENLTAITGPSGTGTGQFPTPAQLLTSGHVVVRKSATADSTNGRIWQLVADASTFYLFIISGDSAGNVYFGSLIFGDFYSLRGSTDLYRCQIAGRIVENGNLSDTGGGQWDKMSGLVTTPGNITGMYAARSFGGGGASVPIGRMGDFLPVTGGTSSSASAVVGALQTPNGTDNSFYLAPLQIFETTTNIIRGRMRGVYQVGHALASFADGQTFQGSNDFSGKSFMIISSGPASGFWAVETSATVETN